MYLIEIVKPNNLLTCFALRATYADARQLVHSWFCEDALKIRVRKIPNRYKNKVLIKKPYVCLLSHCWQWETYFVNGGEWLRVDIDRTPFAHMAKTNSKLKYANRL